MTWTKPDTSYWNDKFTAWWHDPVDKVFNIKGYEDWAADYLAVFGPQRPNEEFWKIADALAAGFERGQIPSYAANESKSGAVDFSSKPVITHPISGKDGQLSLEGKFRSPAEIHAATIEYLKKTVGTFAGGSDLASLFAGNEADFAQARMLFTHLVLRFLLAQKNVAGLGALWHRMPADSRFPDHSIWQHNALCSAIYSCMGAIGQAKNIGMMVFSITPVQSFISQARKLRDYWAGSVILSWLAFEGIRWIVENLGPDHVLYPSLIDQPLMGIYLQKKRGFTPEFLPRLWNIHPKGIASFPNKFVFLIPFDNAEDIASEIKKEIQTGWDDIAQCVRDNVGDKFGAEEKEHLKRLFDRQTKNFWDMRWAAMPLLDISNLKDIVNLLDKSDWEKQNKYFEAIKKVLDSKYHGNASRGAFYSTSHSFVQKALASGKISRQVLRAPEPGEKCQMCGEFEVLHGRPYSVEKAKVYKNNAESFWKKLGGDEPEDTDIKETERLCAVCAVKRFLPRVIKPKRHEDHLLHDVFNSIKSFPSTTEMALFDYYRRNEIVKEEEKKRKAQLLHKDEERIPGEKAPKEKKLKNRDKYYAVLMMDGDKMGDLINGKTIAAKWENILHPVILEKIKNPAFPKAYRDFWTSLLADQRLITPAIHAAISEALGDFAVYGVASIIKNHGGCLVYAGGDDVCAFLPVSQAVAAAKEIRDYYISAFRHIDEQGRSVRLETNQKWPIQSGKLSINLGYGEKISISAAILICHHKESLTHMIKRAHTLLDDIAKNKVDRDACVVELRKRSGGERLLAAKWNDKAWDALKNIAGSTGGTERMVSHSLLYRLEKLKPGFDAIIETKKADKSGEDYVNKLIQAQLGRSGQSRDQEKEKQKEIAEWIQQLVLLKKPNAMSSFDAAPLQIAAFMGGEDHE